MSVTAVRSPAEFEQQLSRYLFERSEEARAVRVGEKETSEQAAIVERYRDLFSRAQLGALHEAEANAGPDDRERLFRLRKTCEASIVAAELAEREDALENATLAARVSGAGGAAAALRAGEARRPARLPRSRRAGRPHNAVSAGFNEERRELLTAERGAGGRALRRADPVARSEAEKGRLLRS